MKKHFHRWLLAIVLVSAIVACATLAVLLGRARRITLILNEHWNPYGNPPEYVAVYPYKRSARKLAIFILLNNPSEELLAERICEIEKEWKLMPRKERALQVAREILDAYHNSRVSMTPTLNTEPLTPPNAVPPGAQEEPTSSPGQRR